MGYDLHITRKPMWANEEGPVIVPEDGPVITPQEWLAIVQSDDELTISGQHGPYFADWSGPGQYPCWVDYSRGELYSKNPTDEFIEKMVQIAKRLDARVEGEEGEEYLGDGQVANYDRSGQLVVYRLPGMKRT